MTEQFGSCYVYIQSYKKKKPQLKRSKSCHQFKPLVKIPRVPIVTEKYKFNQLEEMKIYYTVGPYADMEGNLYVDNFFTPEKPMEPLQKVIKIEGHLYLVSLYPRKMITLGENFDSSKNLIKVKTPLRKKNRSDLVNNLSKGSSGWVLNWAFTIKDDQWFIEAGHTVCHTDWWANFQVYIRRELDGSYVLDGNLRKAIKNATNWYHLCYINGNRLMNRQNPRAK